MRKRDQRLRKLRPISLQVSIRKGVLTYSLIWRRLREIVAMAIWLPRGIIRTYRGSSNQTQRKQVCSNLICIFFESFLSLSALGHRCKYLFSSFSPIQLSSSANVCSQLAWRPSTHGVCYVTECVNSNVFLVMFVEFLFHWDMTLFSSPVIWRLFKELYRWMELLYLLQLCQYVNFLFVFDFIHFLVL